MSTLEKPKTLRQQKMDQAAKDGHGMAWCSIFGILLVIGILYNLGNSIQYFTGFMYVVNNGLNYDQVHSIYANLPALKAVDVIMGCILLVLSVMGIFIIAGLYRFKSYTPLLINLMYIINIVSSLVYTPLVYAIIGVSFGEDEVNLLLGNLVIPVIFLVINYIYFSKRAYLFDR